MKTDIGIADFYIFIDVDYEIYSSILRKFCLICETYRYFEM